MKTFEEKVKEMHLARQARALASELYYCKMTNDNKENLEQKHRALTLLNLEIFKEIITEVTWVAEEFNPDTLIFSRCPKLVSENTKPIPKMAMIDISFPRIELDPTLAVDLKIPTNNIDVHLILSFVSFNRAYTFIKETKIKANLHNWMQYVNGIQDDLFEVNKG